MNVSHGSSGGRWNEQRGLVIGSAGHEPVDKIEDLFRQCDVKQITRRRTSARPPGGGPPQRQAHLHLA